MKKLLLFLGGVAVLWARIAVGMDPARGEELGGGVLLAAAVGLVVIAPAPQKVEKTGSGSEER